MTTALYDLTVGSYTQVLEAQLSLWKRPCTLSSTGNRFGGCCELRDLRGHAEFLFPSYVSQPSFCESNRGLHAGEFGPPMYAFNHKAEKGDYEMLIAKTRKVSL